MLPLAPPILPMLAKRVDTLPDPGDWVFEPKWDGFRALVFRDGSDIRIQSRDAKPLERYFPELVEHLGAQLPERCVLDGEIVIAVGSVLDFDALQLRLHPAQSRVEMLSREIPSSMVFFDLLAVGDRNLMAAPFEDRRAALESLMADVEPPLHVTPATRSAETAADWFRRFEGAGLDGVIAKGASGRYEPKKRVMLKVKHDRECDCVVAGFRWHKNGEGEAVGSLLLGLYDNSGNLQHVGVCASFSDARRRELVEHLAPYRKDALEDHPWREWATADADASAQRRPGVGSRWSQGKDMSWQPLRPELVAEVGYDHMQRTRFRHTAQFRRWRTDKAPRDCTYDQLDVVPPHELAEIFTTGR